MFVQTPTSRVSEPAPKKKRELKSPVDLMRLCKAIRNDRHDLGAFRQKRYFAVQQMVGDGYGDASIVEMPVNLLALYVDVITGATIASQPRVMYSTFDQKQQAAVEAMEAWANPELVAMDAAGIFRRAIQDSLFWMGIVRVALADAVDAEESGWGLKAGQPFIESIDPDDWVCDQGARTFDKVSYSACRYRLPVEVANRIYKSANEFQPDNQTDYNAGGDPRIETIGRTPGWREEVEDHCTIWEVWIPRHRKILLLRDNGGVPDETHGPIAVKDWIGPARGPYHYLGVNIPPGNLNPKGPANDLVILNTQFNNAWRKLLRQTRDYKKLTLYRGTATNDANRVRGGRDGELLNCDDPEGILEREFGGAGQPVWAMAQAMQEAFNFIGGNLALLGGRSAQSKTATQDKLLNENASAGVASIQERTYAFMQRCLESWNWFCWHHPTKVMRSQWQSPSYPELKMNREVGPWDSDMPLKRQGPMPKINIDVYSLARQTPQSRLGFINGVLQTMAPMLPLFTQQGVMIDANALMDTFSKFGNEPELKKVFRYAEPPAPAENGEDMAGGKPASTTRTYQRYGAGEDSDAAKSADLNEQFSSMQRGTMNPNSGTAQ